MRPTTAYITSSYKLRYLPTCIFIIQRNVSLGQVASGSAGSVRVIDEELFYFFQLFFVLYEFALSFNPHTRKWRQIENKGNILCLAL